MKLLDGGASPEGEPFVVPSADAQLIVILLLAELLLRNGENAVPPGYGEKLLQCPGKKAAPDCW